MLSASSGFLKENDFAGKDIYVFVSSGGTGFGDTLQEVQDLQPKARIHEGAAIRQEDAAKAGSSVDSVLAKAKLGKGEKISFRASCSSSTDGAVLGSLTIFSAGR